MRSLRYAAYRIAAWMIFGRLGSKRRRRLPDCLGWCFKLTLYFIYNYLFLVQWIRDQFPAPDGDYTGFADIIVKT